MDEFFACQPSTDLNRAKEVGAPAGVPYKASAVPRPGAVPKPPAINGPPMTTHHVIDVFCRSYPPAEPCQACLVCFGLIGWMPYPVMFCHFRSRTDCS